MIILKILYSLKLKWGIILCGEISVITMLDNFHVSGSCLVLLSWRFSLPSALNDGKLLVKARSKQSCARQRVRCKARRLWRGETKCQEGGSPRDRVTWTRFCTAILPVYRRCTRIEIIFICRHRGFFFFQPQFSADWLDLSGKCE